jgi:peptidoglycan/LPS O-acetylase OafA/YrhL
MFYLLLPLLLLCTPRWPLRRYGWAVLALWVAADGIRLVRVGESTAAGLDQRAIAAALYSPFHVHDQGLLVGLLTAWTVTLRPEWFRRAADAGWSWRGFGVATGMAAAGLGLRASNALVFSYTGLALVYGGALVFVLLDRSWVARLTGAWAWHPIARLSYGMYLNHLIFGAELPRAAVRALRDAGARETLVYTSGLGLTVALSVGIAFCTFIAVERPFLALRDRRLARRAPPTPTATDAAVGAAG